MIEKFTATLPQFSLNRFRRKGLPAVKIEFAEFCKSKLLQN